MANKILNCVGLEAEFTEENLIGKSLMELVWKNDKQPREFTFIFYPEIELEDAVHDLVELFRLTHTSNPQISFNCVYPVPTISIISIFCCHRINEDGEDETIWPFYMEPSILKVIIKLFECDGIGIIWLEDQDFGISVDSDLIITKFWIPDDGG